MLCANYALFDGTIIANPEAVRRIQLDCGGNGHRIRTVAGGMRTSNGIDSPVRRYFDYGVTFLSAMKTFPAASAIAKCGRGSAALVVK